MVNFSNEIFMFLCDFWAQYVVTVGQTEKIIVWSYGWCCAGKKIPNMGKKYVLCIKTKSKLFKNSHNRPRDLRLLMFIVPLEQNTDPLLKGRCAHLPNNSAQLTLCSFLKCFYFVILFPLISKEYRSLSMLIWLKISFD